jgi:hypothetical protein
MVRRRRRRGGPARTARMPERSRWCGGSRRTPGGDRRAIRSRPRRWRSPPRGLVVAGGRWLAAVRAFDRTATGTTRAPAGSRSAPLRPNAPNASRKVSALPVVLGAANPAPRTCVSAGGNATGSSDAPATIGTTPHSSVGYRRSSRARRRRSAFIAVRPVGRGRRPGASPVPGAPPRGARLPRPWPRGRRRRTPPGPPPATRRGTRRGAARWGRRGAKRRRRASRDWRWRGCGRSDRRGRSGRRRRSGGRPARRGRPVRR